MDRLDRDYRNLYDIKIVLFNFLISYKILKNQSLHR
jgi:hypothetical protein